MPDDHPGFELWPVNDINHRFPIGQIKVLHDEDDYGSAEADLALPQAQPTPATVAEAYVGIAHSAQLWFALECTTDAQGNMVCEAVLRGKHVHWFPEHGETQGGPVQEVRLTMADMRGGGRREALAAHGPHCDLFSATWGPNQGKVHCVLSVLHIRNTVEGFLDRRAKANRDADLRPPRVILEPLPPPEATEPPPKPEQEPDPGEGAMAPGQPGGAFGILLTWLKRVVRSVFG